MKFYPIAYKRLDDSMHILNIANKRDFDIPEHQKDLVYAKAMEIRDALRGENRIPFEGTC